MNTLHHRRKKLIEQKQHLDFILRAQTPEWGGTIRPGLSLSNVIANALMIDQITQEDYNKQYVRAIKHINRKKKGTYFERWLKYNGPVNPLSVSDLQDVFHHLDPQEVMTSELAHNHFLGLLAKWKVEPGYTVHMDKLKPMVLDAKISELHKNVLKNFRVQKQTANKDKLWRFSLIIKITGMKKLPPEMLPHRMLNSNKTYGGQLYGVVHAGICSREFVLQNRGTIVQHSNPAIPKNPKFEVDIMRVDNSNLGILPVLVNSDVCRLKQHQEKLTTVEEDQAHARARWVPDRHFFIIKGSPCMLLRAERQFGRWHHRLVKNTHTMSGKILFRGILWNNGPLCGVRAIVRVGPINQLKTADVNCMTEDEVESRRKNPSSVDTNLQRKRNMTCLEEISEEETQQLVASQLPVQVNARFAAIEPQIVAVSHNTHRTDTDNAPWKKFVNNEDNQEIGMVMSLNIGHNKRPLHVPIHLLFTACGVCGVEAVLKTILIYDRPETQRRLRQKYRHQLERIWRNNMGIVTREQAKVVLVNWFRLIIGAYIPPEFNGDVAQYILADVFCPSIASVGGGMPPSIENRIKLTVRTLAFVTHMILQHILDISEDQCPENAPSNSLVSSLDDIVYGAITFAFQSVTKRIHNWLTETDDKLARLLEHKHIETLLNLSDSYTWFKPPNTMHRCSNTSSKKSYRVNVVSVVPGNRFVSSCVERRVGARAHERLRMMTSFIPHYCTIRGPSARKSGLKRYQSVGVILSEAMELTCLQTIQVMVARITDTMQHTPSEVIDEFSVAGLPSRGFDWSPEEKLSGVCIDGCIIAFTHYPQAIYQLMWSLKVSRCAVVAMRHMGVIWEKRSHTLHITTVAGRLIRPVWRVRPGSRWPLLKQDSTLIPWLQKSEQWDRLKMRLPVEQKDFQTAGIVMLRRAIRDGSIVYLGAPSELHEAVAPHWKAVAEAPVDTFGFVDVHPIQVYHPSICTLPWVNFMSGRRAATYSKITNTQSAGRTDLFAPYDSRSEFWSTPLFPHRRVVESIGARSLVDPYPRQCIGTIAAIASDGKDMEDGCKISEYLKFLGQGARVKRNMTTVETCVDYVSQQQAVTEHMHAQGSEAFKFPPKHCITPPERFCEQITTTRHLATLKNTPTITKETLFKDSVLGSGAFPPVGQYIAHQQTIARLRNIDQLAHEAYVKYAQVLRIPEMTKAFTRIDWPHKRGTSVSNVSFGKHGQKLVVNVHTRQKQLIQRQDKINYQGGKGVVNDEIPWQDMLYTASGVPFVGRSPSNLVSRQLVTVLHFQLLSSVDRALCPDHTLDLTNQPSSVYVPFQEVFHHGPETKGNPLTLELCARRANNLGAQLNVSTHEVWLAVMATWGRNSQQCAAMRNTDEAFNEVAKWKVLFPAACYTSWSIAILDPVVRDFPGAALPHAKSVAGKMRKNVLLLLSTEQEDMGGLIEDILAQWQYVFEHYMKVGATVRGWDCVIGSCTEQKCVHSEYVLTMLQVAWGELTSCLKNVWLTKFQRWQKHIIAGGAQRTLRELGEFVLPMWGSKSTAEVVRSATRSGYQGECALTRYCETRAYCGQTGLPLKRTVTVGHAEYDILPRHSSENVYKARARGNVSIDSFMPFSKNRWERGTRIGRLRVNATLARDAIDNVGPLLNAQCDPVIFHYCERCHDFAVRENAREEFDFLPPQEDQARFSCFLCGSSDSLYPVRGTYAALFKTHEYMRAQGISLKYAVSKGGAVASEDSEIESEEDCISEDGYCSLSN